MTAPITPNPIDKVSVYIAAGLISGCGALMFNVMPVFVGAMADTFQFRESELGDIIAGFNAGFTLIAITALFWIRKLSWRLAAIAGAALSAAALVTMSYFSRYLELAILTFVVGLGMGALYALVMAVLGDSDTPDKAFGLKLGLETLPGAILLFLLPVVIVPSFGFQGVVVCMAATIVMLGMASFYIPVRGVKSFKSVTSFRDKQLWLNFLSLGASLVFFSGIAASWAFLERMGDIRNLPRDQVGVILAIAFLVCGLGGFVAATTAGRYGKVVPMLTIITVNCAGLWILSGFSTPLEYALGCCLFLFSVNFTLAYTFGMTAEVNRGGRMVVLSSAVLSIGAVIGPATAGRLIESNGYSAMLVFSAGCSVIALVMYMFTHFVHRASASGVENLLQQ